MNRPDQLVLPHGGYRRLRRFQVAQAVYDGTVVFCGRFIDRRSRTYHQTIQAARSRVQNIAEGSVTSGTSKKAELKLTNVARASLSELILDYEDFLRQRGLRIWNKDSPEALATRRRLAELSDMSDPSDSLGLKSASAEFCANTMICLAHQASYLLGRSLRRLEQDFLAEGGFTERLYQQRRAYRDQSPPPPAKRR